MVVFHRVSIEKIATRNNVSDIGRMIMHEGVRVH